MARCCSRTRWCIISAQQQMCGVLGNWFAGGHRADRIVPFGVFNPPTDSLRRSAILSSARFSSWLSRKLITVPAQPASTIVFECGGSAGYLMCYPSLCHLVNCEVNFQIVSLGPSCHLLSKLVLVSNTQFDGRLLGCASTQAQDIFFLFAHVPACSQRRKTMKSVLFNT